MEPSRLSTREIGPGSYPDVTKIPTPPLQRGALAIMFLLPALATLIFGLRIHIRVRMGTLGLDDYLCGCALIASIMVSSSLFMFFKLSYYGWEDDKVPDFDPSPGLWWNFFEQLWYNPVLAFVKLSVLVFLLRLGGCRDAIFRAAWFLITVTILHAVAVFFGALFQCVPIETNWHPELREDPNTRCIDNSFHIIQSSLIIVTDACVLALPFWIFLGLRMPRNMKFAVLGVFAVGILVPIVAIVRLVNLYRLLYLGEKFQRHNISYIWTAVEVNLAVMSCSMPALRPLLGRLFPRIFGGDSRQSGDQQPYQRGTSKDISSRNSRSNTHRGGRSMNYVLDDLNPARKHAKTEVRGVSPSASEEEIMRPGIMRTMNVNVMYEDAKRSDAGSNMSGEMS